MDAVKRYFTTVSDSKLLKVALSGLGSGAIKLRKADDHAYDELRKIPAAIGIDIKGLVK